MTVGGRKDNQVTRSWLPILMAILFRSSSYISYHSFVKNKASSRTLEVVKSHGLVSLKTRTFAVTHKTRKFCTEVYPCLFVDLSGNWAYFSVCLRRRISRGV